MGQPGNIEELREVLKISWNGGSEPLSLMELINVNMCHPSYTAQRQTCACVLLRGKDFIHCYSSDTLVVAERMGETGDGGIEECTCPDKCQGPYGSVESLHCILDTNRTCCMATGI